MHGRGGQTFAANELPTDNTITIKQDIEYQTNDSIKANTITGEGQSAHLTITDGKNQEAVFIVNDGNEFSVTNLNSLTILNPNKSSDGLEATGSATIDISNVNTVNIGTKNTSFNPGGQAIHGESGFVKLHNINDLNIYTNGQGIMAQRNVGDDPSVDIQAKGNIHIEAQSNAVMAGTINDNFSGAAGLNMTAKGRIDISSKDGVAVESFDKSYPYNGHGNTSITIHGDEGVSVVTEGNLKDRQDAYAILMLRDNISNEGSTDKSTLDISSKYGDVVIQAENGGKGVLMQLQGDTKTSENAPKISGSISGNNVYITSSDTAVTVKYSDLTLKSNQKNGTVSLQSGSGTAATVSGNDKHPGKLTIGDGEQETNFVSNGSLYIGKNATVTVADKTTTYVDVNALKGNSFIQNDDGGTFQASL